MSLQPFVNVQARWVCRPLDFTLNRLRRAVLRYPGQLILGSLEIAAQILVRLRLDRSVPGRIEPVESGVSECRRQRICGDDYADDCRRGSLRPHPVFYSGEKEKRNQRLETVCCGRSRTVYLSIELGSSETKSETPVHGGRHGYQYAGCQYP